MERKHNWNDLSGQKFGRWTAVEYAGAKRWLCICECGTYSTRSTTHLRRGSTQSCGCLQKELIGARNHKHGMVGHPAYVSWASAKNRCTDPTRSYYSQRGIKMCDKWQTFEAFWEDMGPTWSPGLSIDRIDNTRDYEPSNCRWSTKKVQSNNRSSCVMIPTPEGEMNITQASEAFGINRWTIARRIRAGWTANRLLAPVNK